MKEEQMPLPLPDLACFFLSRILFFNVYVNVCVCVVACGNQAASGVVLSSTIPHPFEAGSLIGLVLSKRLDCLASVPQGSIGVSASPVLGLQHTWNIYVGSKDRPLVLMFAW